jgi:hypothetical protein
MTSANSLIDISALDLAIRQIVGFSIGSRVYYRTTIGICMLVLLKKSNILTSKFT